MGLKTAPSEMQLFADATVQVVESRFAGVRGLAYLDDFCFCFWQGRPIRCTESVNFCQMSVCVWVIPREVAQENP